MITQKDALDNYFISNKFNITTPAIMDFQKNVLKWVSDGTPGAVIYGRPRIGKTRAILYIDSALKAKYGSELPIYVLNVTEHVPKDKFFYSELLKAIGHVEFEKGTVSVLKERLLNALFTSACNTKYRKIIFIHLPMTYLDGLNYKTFILVNYMYKIYTKIRYQEIKIQLTNSKEDDYPLNSHNIPIKDTSNYPVFLILELYDGKLLLY